MEAGKETITSVIFDICGIHRAGKGGNMAKLTPIKAIRAKCLDCSNGQFKEVRLCPVKNCPLYEYRGGHRPKSEELTAENDLDKKS